MVLGQNVCCFQSPDLYMTSSCMVLIILHLQLWFVYYELSAMICLYFLNLPYNSCLASFLHQRLPITTHLADIYGSAIVLDYNFNYLWDKSSSLWSTDFHLVSICQKEFSHVSRSLLLERWMGWNIKYHDMDSLDVAQSAYVLCMEFLATNIMQLI